MPSSGTLSDAQIAGAAKAAGFSGEALAKAVAVALAESGGNPRAHNAVPPDNSYGLWQINMLGSMGPARRKQFGLSSNSQLFDPVTNAKAAYAISSQGKNFRPWTTYTSGAYLRYLSRARKAAGNPSSAPGGVAGATPAGFIPGLDEVTTFFDILTDSGTWIRVGMFVAGGILLLLGLFKLSGQTDKAMALLDFVPGGKVAKKAVK